MHVLVYIIINRIIYFNIFEHEPGRKIQNGLGRQRAGRA